MGLRLPGRCRGGWRERILDRAETSNVPLMARMTIEAGRVLNDRYRLVRPVGQGAQAAVWVADHLALTTHVAVKLIDPELAKQDDARERFRREATAAAQLRSAHVVQILDHGIDDGQPFIVMELLEGEDLFERIEKLGRLTLKDTSKIVTQVARALARAHSAGIVHRDLKPENVFLVPNEDDEIAKVLDFGVAKVTNAAKATMQRTGVGTLLGTPHYMSPEQVKGVTEVDFRTDLWALGVIAYQCVTGDLPFDSEGVGDLLLKITVGEVPIPSKVVPGLPSTFDAWFAKSCDRDPNKRFDSARDMADALARAVGIPDKRPATIPRPIPARTATPTPDSEPPPSAAPSSKRAKAQPPPVPKAKPSGSGSKEDPARKSLRPLIPAAVRKRVSRPPVQVLDSEDLEEEVDGDEVAVALTPLSLRSQLESTDVSFEEGEGAPVAPVNAPTPPVIQAESATAPQPPAIEPEPSARTEVDPPVPEEASSPPSSRRAEAPPAAAPVEAPPAPREPQQVVPVEAANPAPARLAPAGPPPRPAPAPAPVSVRSPDTSRSAHSSPPSTVSGLASPGDTYIPPEFDGSRRRRTLGFVVFGFIAVAAAVAWFSVRPYLQQPPPPGPAIPPPTEVPSAVDIAPPLPIPTGSAAEPLPSAVNPGRPRAPGSVEAEPTPTATPKQKGRWKKKDDVEFVIPDPHPED